jgi:high-affinity iron transporter
VSPLIKFAFILSLWAAPVNAAAPAGEASPRFVVNLLDYVAQDYGGAVANGKITSESEYHEQVEFTESALASVRSLPTTPATAPEFKAIAQEIEGLLKQIEAKAPPERVAERAQTIKQRVIKVSGLPVAPTQWPNLKAGARLFAQNCVACHGATGHGDGPAGASLDPKPANFHDPSMAKKSPFREFNVIRVGVPGTAMAPFNTLSDQDAWNLSFFVLSLRHGSGPLENAGQGADLADLATHSDEELLVSLRLGKSEEERRSRLATLRLATGSDGPGGPLVLARTKLDESLSEYRDGNKGSARQSALAAYLEGVEPVEARLRANSPAFVPELEQKMAAVRAAIEKDAGLPAIEASVVQARKELDEASALLSDHPQSAWLTFLIASGVLLREGFEAVLILIALLAVIRASGASSRKKGEPDTIATQAARWVHAGWVSALGLGFAAWFFSGWLMGLSGANREMLEAVTSLLAVGVLLYMGFWLHSRTELNRWNHFIHTQVKEALAGGNLYGIFAISFMAVFREAFETVLFLRAVWLEGGDETKMAMAAGVFGALALIIVFAWSLLRFSAKLPVRTLFSISSGLMALLSVILIGKGFHSLQETGSLSVSIFPLEMRSNLLGIFPTYETWIGQVVVLALCIALWAYGKRPTTVSPRTQLARG